MAERASNGPGRQATRTANRNQTQAAHAEPRSKLRYAQQRLSRDSGMRAVSWTGLGGRPGPLPAAPDRIVRRPPALAERLEARPAVPAGAGRRLPGELPRGRAGPVPAEEELDLGPAEGALAGGVVRRAAPARRRPRDAALGVRPARPPAPNTASPASTASRATFPADPGSMRTPIRTPEASNISSASPSARKALKNIP